MYVNNAFEDTFVSLPVNAGPCTIIKFWSFSFILFSTLHESWIEYRNVMVFDMAYNQHIFSLPDWICTCWVKLSGPFVLCCGFLEAIPKTVLKRLNDIEYMYMFHTFYNDIFPTIVEIMHGSVNLCTLGICVTQYKT